MKKLSKDKFELIVNSLYKSYTVKQLTIQQIATNCEVSLPVIIKIKSILIDKNLLISDGTRKSNSYWNSEKAKPNPAMIEEVYRVYYSKCGIKDKKTNTVSLETALRTLTKLGYVGVIQRSRNDGFITKIEQIDLAKFH